MGYYTDYTVDVSGDKNEEVLDAIKEQSGYGNWQGNELVCVKWYDCASDVKKVSIMFPDTLIELSGEGEESGDLWKEYFLNGKSQFIKAKLMFEPFDKEKLK